MGKASIADMTRGRVSAVFFYHAIPNVLGMMALSSSGIVDGIFVGNYVGEKALASINIIMPLFSVLMGVGIMFSVGGMVRCGKYIGEGKTDAASSVFSKTLITVAATTLLLVLLGMAFTGELASLLGANAELAPLVHEYLFWFLAFMVFIPLSLCLAFFVRVDGQPILAAVAIVASALLNIFLNWVFVVLWAMGLKGAALATGLAHFAGFAILLAHFLSRRSVLRFSFRQQEWREMLGAAYNGMSEFANQLSAAVVILVFNWVMIRRFGVEGVAAFTIMHYLFFAEQVVIYGFSDALQPIVSTNFGARKASRITRFLSLALACSVLVGVIVVALLLVMPERIASIFLHTGNAATMSLTLAFIALSWPAFLFNGVNVVFSAYFTAIHKPFPSAVIGFSRTLVFPLLLIAVLPWFIGDSGIYVSFAIAEMVTFLIVLAMFSLMPPSRAVGHTVAPR